MKPAKRARTEGEIAVPPGFNTPIPPEILTPDEVKTRLGTLRFFDGLPDDATVNAVYDNLDLMRATEVFLNFIPAASLECLRAGCTDVGGGLAHQLLMAEKLMD